MARGRIRWPLVVDRAREIADGYAPLKFTLRQVMYRLAAEGVLPHTPPMYGRLSAQLARARRGGRFPDLIDTVREVHVPPHGDAFVAEMPAWFRLDRTAGKTRALYVAGKCGGAERVPGASRGTQEPRARVPLACQSGRADWVVTAGPGVRGGGHGRQRHRQR